MASGLALLATALPTWGETITTTEKLAGSPPEPSAAFGTQVATDGELIVAGAKTEDFTAMDQGAVYVFGWDGGQWTEVAKLHASDGTAYDYFGSAVAVSGNTLLVGAYGDEGTKGSAYVFERTGSTTVDWHQTAKITVSDVAGGDQFAKYVALDGDTAVIGVPKDDDAAADAGSVFVFERNQGGAGAWGQVQKLLPDDAQNSMAFGCVAVSGDTIAVGAYGMNTGVNGAGAVYVHGRDVGGTGNWGKVTKIQMPVLATNAYFGYSISLDGDLLLVGAWGVSSAKGKAYLYGRNVGGTDNWGQIAEFSPDAAGQRLGFSVALHGTRLAIGAPRCSDVATSAGALYLFESQDAGSTWQRTQKLTIAESQANDYLGTFVAVADDIVIAASESAPVSGQAAAGAAYVLSTHQYTAYPSCPDLLAGSDTGIATDDDITRLDNSAGATLQFEVPDTIPGALVTLYADRTTLIGTATADATTTTVTTNGTDALTHGTHQITARQAVDGTQSVPSSALTITIDTQAPDPLGAPDLQAASDSGAFADDDLTNDATPTFDVVPSNGNTFRFLVDGNPVSGDFESGTSYTVPACDDGEHVATIMAVDVAGNPSLASPPLPFTVDTTAPVQPAAPDLSAASDTGAADDDNLTSDTTPTFTITSADPYYRISCDGAAISGWETVADYTVPAQVEGTHGFTVRVADAAGNQSVPSAALDVTIDTTGPTVAIAPIAPNPRYDGLSAATIVFSEPVAGFDLADLSLVRDGGANLLTGGETLASDDATAWTLSGISTVTDAVGAYELALGAGTAGITDRAGNALATGAAETWDVVPKALAVTVADGWEGGTAAGVVSVPLPPATGLTVTLASGDDAKATAPLAVTIGAGTTSTPFVVTLLSDNDTDGRQTVTITASATGYTPDANSFIVHDSDVDRLAFDAIGCQAVDTAFTVNITAENIDGETVPSYVGTAGLSGNGDGGAVVLAPTTTAAFVAGVWTGAIAVATRDTNVVLTADDGTGHTGQSSAFSVVGNNEGEIRGYVWRDADRNGTQGPGDGPLAGWRVFVDSDRNGVWNAGEPFDLSDADGNYTLVAPAGTWFVTETVPAPYVRTVPTDIAGADAVSFGTFYDANDAGLSTLASLWPIAVSPDGGSVYACQNGDGYRTLTVLDRSAETGNLTVRQTLTDDDTTVDGLDGAQGIVVSPDGKHVYVIGSSDDAIGIFARTAGTGELTCLGTAKDGQNGVADMSYPYAAAVSPDGAQLYVASYSSNAIVILDRNPDSGLLSYAESVVDSVQLAQARAITVSPDGKSVYVCAEATAESGYLTVYARDLATGRLTYQQEFHDGAGGVDRLLRPMDVAIAPDGKHVYVTAGSDQALNLFARDAADGRLTYQDCYVQGGDISGLNNPLMVRVSADGQKVYVSADSTLAVCDRAAASGALTWQQVFTQGADGVSGLAGVRSMAVSPDNLGVYCAARTDGGISQFTRDLRASGAYRVELASQQTISGRDFANEPPILTVSLPPTASEGSGVLATAGTVTLSPPPTATVVVDLASSDTGELSVPAMVTIPTGVASVTFPLTLVDDDAQDGAQPVTVTASIADCTESSTQTTVLDNDPDHFRWSAIAAQQAGVGFVVTITAEDASNVALVGFAGTVTLAGEAGGEAVSVSPASSPAFASGSWTGSITVEAVATGVTLTANNGTASGTSAAFDVRHGAADHFVWSPIGSTTRYLGYRIDATLTAKDAHGYTVSDYNGTADLDAYLPDEVPVSADMLGFPYHTYNNSSSTSYSHRGICFTPSKDITVTHVEHYSGDYVNLYRESDHQLMFSQPVTSTAGAWRRTALTTPVALAKDTTYRLVARLAPGTRWYYSLVSSVRSHFADGTLDGGVYYDTASTAAEVYPDNPLSSYAYFVDFTYILTPTAFPLSPATATFASGTWTGSLAVGGLCTDAALRATDGAGVTGSSDRFSVVADAPLAVTVPASAGEDAGTLVGQGSIQLAGQTAAQLVVTLSSSDASAVAVTPSLTIPAGESTATFDLTVGDNAVFDAIRTPTITATAANHANGTATIAIVDDETTTITVAVPDSATEGDGTLTAQGSVTLGTVAGADIVISLTSGDTSEVTVPPTVTVLAGQSSAVFDLTIVDDNAIDGPQSALISAAITGLPTTTCTPDSIAIADNEDSCLTVSLPADAAEGQGVLPDAGTVSLSGTWSVPLVVSLASGKTSEVTVPAFVTIPAGSTAVTFSLTIIDDAVTDGTQAGIEITATAAGFTPGVATLAVRDNDLDHLAFAPISRQNANEPFAATITAYDSNGEVLTAFAGSVELSGRGDKGSVTLVPTAISTFANGVWTGNVTVANSDSNVVLTADDGAGHAGQSNAFLVLGNEGEVKGNVWSDAAGNAVKDVGDEPLADWQVYVDLNQNGQWDAEEPSGRSDANGDYTITAPPGPCVVAEVVKDRFRRTFPASLPETDPLSFVQSVDWVSSNGPGVVDATITPDGKHLYAVDSYGWTMAGFSRDPATGALTLVQTLENGTGSLDAIRGPTSVVSSPDGAYVYVNSEHQDAVSVFRRDAATGLLTYRSKAANNVSGVANLDGPIWVELSPDGRHLYAAAADSNAIVVLNRDAATGALTYGSSVVDAVKLEDVSYLQVSPDGRNLYAINTPYEKMGYLTVFDRDSETGALTYREEFHDGAANIDTLAGPHCLDLSPDGDYVYVTALDDSSLNVFTRDPNTGSLTLFTCYTGSVDGSDGLRYVEVVAVSPDGRQLFAGSQSHGISAFDRDRATGLLTWRQVLKDQSNGDYDIAGVRAICVSADGLGIYCSSLPGNAVSFFARHIPQNGAHWVTVPLHGTVTGCDFGNEPYTLTVSLPTEAVEGAAALAEAGTVSITEALEGDLQVTLGSSDASQVTVPATLTIPAGQTSVPFTLTILDDAEPEGPQTVTITARATDYAERPGQISILDNDPDHFAWSAIASPQHAGAAFPVTITAQDASNAPVTNFTGPATISAMADASPVVVSPSATTSFSAGVWSGVVAVEAIAGSVQLTATSGGASGLSGAFAIAHGALDHFAWDPVDSPQHENLPFSATVTAKDAHGYTVASYAATVSLSLYSLFPASGTIFGARAWANRYTTSSTLYEHRGISFTPSKDLTVTHVRHCFGTHVNIHRESDQALLVSQPVTSTPGTWIETALDTPVPLLKDTAYRISARLERSQYYHTYSPYLPLSVTDGKVNSSVWTSASSGDPDCYPQFSSVTVATPLVGIRYDKPPTYWNQTLTPSTAVFANGTWTGTVTMSNMTLMSQGPTNSILRASSGAGIQTDSSIFEVYGLPPVTVTLPATAGETSGVLAGLGSVSLIAPTEEDLVVTLSSSDASALSVPATVTILANQSSVIFDLSVIDNDELQCTRTVTVTASATGHRDTTASVQLLDDEGATVTVTIPATASEGDGPLLGGGTVTFDRAPATAVTVALTTSDATEATVPASVTLPAGQTTVAFNLTIPDDTEIDGTQSATITATAPALSPATGTIAVSDNESTALTVTLPASATEGDGTLPGLGTVGISGTLSTPLDITLVSGDTSELAVPPLVTIPPGQTSVCFDLIIVDDSVVDGPQTDITVTAAATGFLSQAAAMDVLDNEPHHLVISTIATPQVAGVAFALAITAEDASGAIVTAFTGTAALSAISDDGPLPLSLSTTAGFVAGKWTGTVLVDGVADNVRVIASVGGANGLSDPFDCENSALASFVWGSVPSPRYRNIPFPVTIAARDTRGYVYRPFQSPVGLLASSLATPETRTAGEVNTSSTTSPVPISVGYRQSRSQSIYGPGDVGAAGWITHIAYYQHTSLSLTQDITRCVVRARHTTLTGFPSAATAQWESPDSLQVLFDGLWVLKSGKTGWRTIALDTPFWYNGVDNLMLDISACYEPIGGQGTNWRVASLGGYPACYYNTPARPLDAAGPTAWTGTDVTRYQSSYRPVTQFTICPSLPVAVTPTATADFQSGLWSGMATVTEAATKVALIADDGAVHTGASGVFDVLDGVPLTVSVALPSVTEGDAPTTGTITVSEAPAADLTVSLSSSVPTAATVPTTVTVPSGATSATFAITPVDDPVLDGPQATTITAAAPGYATAQVALQVLDNESATLVVTVPASVAEGDATLAAGGVVSLSAPPSVDVQVHLEASDASEVIVPSVLVIRAGETAVPFDLTPVNDIEIDGTQSVRLTAHVDGWADGTATVDVQDNEEAAITVLLPASAVEGDGTLDQAGTVLLGGTWGTDLAVTLTSSDESELTIHGPVTIRAGELLATFSLTVVDETTPDAHQTVTVQADAVGIASGSAAITIRNNDPHHFSWSTIPADRSSGVAFAVVVTAQDASNATLTDFTGAVSLTATGSAGEIPLSPAVSGDFVGGVWTGEVAVLGKGTAVTLCAEDAAGATGFSNAFDVSPGSMHHFEWGEVGSRQVPGEAFPVTARATDANGYTVESFAGNASFSAMTLKDTVPVLSAGTGTGTNSTYPFRMQYYKSRSQAIYLASEVGGSQRRILSIAYYIPSAKTVDATLDTITVRMRHTTMSTFDTAAWQAAANLTTVYSGRLTVPAGTSGWVTINLDTPFLYNGTNNLLVDTSHTTATTQTTVPSWRTSSCSGNPTCYYYDSSSGSGASAPDPLTWSGTTVTPSTTYWRADIRLETQEYTALPLTPTSGVFANGAWSGLATITATGGNVVLIASDGLGHTGCSTPFCVRARQPVTVDLGADATTESSGTLAVPGTVSIPQATEEDLVVSLSSDAPELLSVPATVTIEAGQTSATFVLTAIDNALCEGNRTVTVNAFGPGCNGSSDTIAVEDDEVHPVIAGTDPLDVAMDEDGAPTPFSLTLHAADANDDALAWSIQTQALHGTATATGTGFDMPIAYVPTADWNGDDSFVVRVSDGTGGTDEITVNVTVNAVNDVPAFALSGDITAEEDFALARTVTATPSAVPADEVGQTVTYSLAPASVALANVGIDPATGTVTIAAVADAHGSQEFTVTATDSLGGEATATFTLLVNAVNDAPTIAGGDSVAVTMDEDGAPRAFALTLEAADPDADTLSWSIRTQALHGTATAAGTGETMAIAYVPTTDWSGDDSFVVAVDDGHGTTDEITVNVTVSAVNDVPAFALSGDVTVDEDFAPARTVTATPGAVPADEAAQTVTYSLAPASVAFANVGIDPATGTVTIAAVADASGSQEFTVTATDSLGGEATDTFTLLVNAVNDVPAFALSGDITAEEDFAPARTVIATPAAVPADEAGQTVTYSLAPATVAFASVAIDPATGTVTIAAVADASGSQEFTVTATDSLGGEATATFTLLVNAVNDAPVFADGDSAAVVMDEDGAPRAFALTLEAADPDADTLTWSIRTQALHGTATAAGTGETMAIAYVPTADWSGDDSFVVAVDDGHGTTDEIAVTVTVNPVDDGPTVANAIDDVTADEDAADIGIGLADVFADIDSATIAKTVLANTNEGLVTATIDGDTLTLHFLANANGTAEITVRSTADGKTVDDTFAVTVNAIDDGPTVANAIDDVTADEDAADVVVALADVFADIDSAAVVATIQANTNEGLVTATIDGDTLTLHFLANANGTAQITVRGTADGKTADDTFAVTVNAIDDGPTVANPIDDVTADEDAADVVVALADVFADIDSAAVVATIQANTDEALVAATIDGDTLTLHFLADANGTADITVRGTADGKTVDDTFTVTVNAIDDGPTVANPIADVAADEDAADVVVALADVFADIDSATVVATIQANTNEALVTATIDGDTLTLHFAADANGTADITVRGTADGKTVDDTFTVTVNPVDDAPTVANPIADVTADEDAADVVVALADVFADIDSAAIAKTVLANTDEALVAATIDGDTLTLHFLADANGTADITVRGTADGKTVDDTFTVTVNAIDDGPTVANPIADVTADEDAADVVVALADVFADIDSATVVATIQANTNEALVTATIDGDTLTLHFLANANGTAEITVRGTADGKTADDTFAVTVNPVDDGPTVANPIDDVTADEDAADIGIGLADVFADIDSATVVATIQANTNEALVTATIDGDTLTLHFLANVNGTAEITVRGTADGKTADDTFAVTVNPVDDGPTVANAIDDVTADEDAADIGIGLADVFADIDSATVVATIQANTNEALVTATIDGDTLTLHFAADANGTADITVRGTADGKTVDDTFTVTVNPVDDAPTVANPIADVTADEDAADVVVALADVFADIDSAAIAKTVLANTDEALVAATIDGDTLTLHFLADANGTADITVRGTADGKTVDDTFTVTVNAIDDGPTVANPIADVTADEDAADVVVALADVFADIDSATVVATIQANTNEALVTATIDGDTLTLHFLANANGTAEITVRGTADGKTADDTFAVTVNPVDDGPTVANPIDDVTADEDAADIGIGLADVFADIDSATVVATIQANTNEALVTATIDGDTLTLHFLANVNGTAEITVRGTADGKTADDTFAVTVNPVDDGPTVANAIDDVTADEDAADVVVALADVFADIDSAAIAKTVLANTNEGLVTATIDGDTLTLHFLADANGTAEITVRGTADGKTADDTFAVTVNAIDDGPTVANPIDDVTADEDADDVVVALADVFADIDSAAIAKTVLANTNEGLVTATIDGDTLTLHFLANANGTAQITVRGTADGKAADDTFAVTVNPVNDAPVINGQEALETVEQTPLTITLAVLQVVDPDSSYPDGFSLSVQDGANYTRSGNTITSVAGFTGTLIVPVLVNDGELDSVLFDLTVTVLRFNQAPTLDLDAETVGTDHAAMFVEAGGAVPIVDVDGLTVADVDDTQLQGAAVRITNLRNGADELLTVDTGLTGITAAYDSGNGVLTLSGTASLADYQSVLRTVTYDNLCQAPDMACRMVEFCVMDGRDTSAAAYTALDFCTRPVVFQLVAGWNLLAMPFDAPEGWTVDDLLVDDQGQALTIGTIRVWDPTTLQYETTSLLPAAGAGFWVYSMVTGPTAERHGTGYSTPTNGQVMGWHLCGPLACSDATFTIPPTRDALLWDAVQRIYVVPDAETPVRPGMGCWIYFAVPEE